MTVKEVIKNKEDSGAKSAVAIPKQFEELFNIGAHFGFSKSKRHPTFKQMVYGAKNGFEIIDLEKTVSHLEKTLSYVRELGASGKKILFVSSKSEAKDIVKKYAEEIEMPYVAGRWIGGTLTNFSEVKKRVDRLHSLTDQKSKGEFSKYTKKERLMFDREIETLNKYFSGLSKLTKIPDAMFIVDPKKEKTAISEAKKMKVPIIALASTDCDISSVSYLIPANDASRTSVSYFVEKVASAYKGGK